MANNWVGYGYPITNGVQGYFGGSSGTNQIKSDLLILLLTNPGERVNLIFFGTPLRELIFEPGDGTLVTRAKQMIINSITQWEPRIIVDDISVSLNPPTSILNTNDDLSEINAILLIQIQFRDPNILSQAQELVLEVPLQGS